MFEDFTSNIVDVGEARLFVRYGGDGPAVLLLHGHPRTSATWHQVAPRLMASGFTVVCPDLRGYGRSRGPAPMPDHSQASKRAMAADMASLMRTLGHRSCAVAGHDRGGYVALRLALDHPEVVTKLAVLDCIPISEHLSRAGAEFATWWWHWFFFAQPDKPERAINADPLAWYGADPDTMGRPNYDEWRHAVTNPDVVRAMLEDYRAGLTIDRGHEQVDRDAGRRIDCPVLVGWSTRDDIEALYGDPTVIWRGWADDVRGVRIESGHHMAEQAPAQLAAELIDFFGSDPHSP